MEKQNQHYIGRVTKFNEQEKTVDCVIMHYDKSNENRWIPEIGCLDAFLERVVRAKKFIPVCYQHDQNNLIGQLREWSNKDGALIGKIYLDDIPFVRDVVLVQLKSGTLQGSSPTIAPITDYWNEKERAWSIKEGALAEVSLVGLPADLKADIVEYSASIEKKRKDIEIEKNNFELNLLIN